ncbi:MAG: hypothetical protein QOH82_618 [Mycobacterium sp.]|nr:hypothetical protein [Mycobacterium sp.]
MLQRASAAADRIAELERLVAEQDSTFTDKYGTVRPSPLLAEIRSDIGSRAVPGRYPDECRACGEESNEAACRAEELGRSHRSRQPETGVMASKKNLDPTVGGHHLPGVYKRIRDKELAATAKPDPRAVFGREGAEREAAAASNLRTQPRQQRCVLDVDALEAHEPVTVPRWYLGGHSFPEARDLPEHRDPNLKGYTVTADDRVTPIFEP